MKNYKYLTETDVAQIKQTCAHAADKCRFPQESAEYKRWVTGKLAGCEAVKRMHAEQLGMTISVDWPKHVKPWTDELRHVKCQVFAEIGERIVNG